MVILGEREKLTWENLSSSALDALERIPKGHFGSTETGVMVATLENEVPEELIREISNICH